ncbi:carbon monoxide dehydrogenase subunit G [Mycoplana sp. BE70]|uniref:CoxG family protein n=1 Tax=Mycoplana sp. BE70 TaxID=2817775 RepID=UPI00285F3A3D|nr:carbon monoxide dehydrogenase subunit G [Mycoplana sp. BE70]MDR6755410.1 carbon monoxide dehydrogenase subunit G [Mycoplana sp. BE70]
MQMKDSVAIPADRRLVWEALNNPEILRQCIPGCEELEMISQTELRAQVLLKIGPIKARFAGEVTLSDLDPPNGYVLSGEGKGGVAGMAKGAAHLKLREEPVGHTILEYEARVDVGGKIAQLGARLLDTTATKLTRKFFEDFSQLVSNKSDN